MKTTTSLLSVLLLAFLASPVMARPGDWRKNGKEASARVSISKSKEIKHKVKRGETLFSIAEKYYGTGYEWVKLKEYNPWVDQDHLPIGEIIVIPDPRRIPLSESGNTSLNPGNPQSLLGWIPDLGNMSLFGKSMVQILLILMTWFFFHFILQGIFVWFAAHLAFVKDVSMKKAMKATFQSESLAFACLFMACIVGLMLLYVGTTSPGNPVTAELLATAETYLGSPSGILVAGLVIVAVYGFLGIRFIPPAFGMEPGRGIAVVFISILLPHLIGFYLLGHRIGIIN